MFSHLHVRTNINRASLLKRTDLQFRKKILFLLGLKILFFAVFRSSYHHLVSLSRHLVVRTSTLVDGERPRLELEVDQVVQVLLLAAEIVQGANFILIILK
jgi:hypothetical protein